jgi:hypothetical protein
MSPRLGPRGLIRAVCCWLNWGWLVLKRVESGIVIRQNSPRQAIDRAIESARWQRVHWLNSSWQMRSGKLPVAECAVKGNSGGKGRMQHSARTRNGNAASDSSSGAVTHGQLAVPRDLAAASLRVHQILAGSRPVRADSLGRRVGQFHHVGRGDHLVYPAR